MNLTYMVETDWAVHWLRGNEQILERLSNLRKRGLGLSIISLAELYAGVYRSTDISEASEAKNLHEDAVFLRDSLLRSE